jgi:hypothetical protein
MATLTIRRNVRPIEQSLEDPHRQNDSRNNPANIHQNIPKVPDVLWVKKLLSFDRRKRSSREAREVLQPRARGVYSTPRPSTPTRFSTTTEIGSSDRTQPTIRGNTTQATSDADTNFQNDLLRLDQRAAVRNPSAPTEGSQPISRVGATAQLQPTPASDNASVTPIAGTHVPARSQDATDYHISNPATKPAVPAVRPDRVELRIKDDYGLAHRNPQKEQYALRHVYMAVEHCMKDSERTLAALLIDMEDYNGSRRISVTCYDGAVDKAREIESILFRAGKGLQGYSFIVHRKKGATTFGFRVKGPGSDHHYSYASVSDRARMYIGEVRPSEHGLKNHEETHHRPKGGQSYANTMYWTSRTTMVECFLADQPSGNMAAMPIRMQVGLDDGTFDSHTWTCGGIMHINGTNYGLTTAHPYVLSDAMRPKIPSCVKQSSEGTDVAGNFFPDDDIDDLVDADFFSRDQHLESYWQSLGKVSHYALAKIGSLPCNNDWLLIDLLKDRIVWNEFKGAVSPDPNVLAVHTSRAVLVATLIAGSAHLIIGDSPFEVLKVGLSEPLRKYINV